MRKRLTAVLTVAVMAGALAAVATPVLGQGHRGGGGHAGGWGGHPGYHGGGYPGGYYRGGYWRGGYYYAPWAAGALGFAFGSALAAPYYSYSYTDTYDYDYGPDYAYPQAAPPAGCQSGQWVWHPELNRYIWVMQPC